VPRGNRDAVYMPYHRGDRIVRSFVCKQCGQIVKVVGQHDRRRSFCSFTCQRRYFRHRYRKKGERLP